MTARHLQNLLTLSLVISLLITVVAVVLAIALPMIDEPLLTTWQVYIDANPNETIINTGAAAAWTIEQNQGILSIETTALGLGLTRAFSILVIWGMVIGILWFLRQVVRDVEKERPFSMTSAQCLKRAGYLLLALSVWLFIEEFIRFFLFMPDGMGVIDFGFTSIRLLTESETVITIYADYNFGLLIAGLFILVIANAYKIGVELQRDSDEII